MKRLNIRNVLNYAVIAVTTVIFSGCVAVQPFPHVARAGDTITLAIGSLDGANRSNVTVNYFADSDPLVPIDMTANVRSVMKILPDKTSKAYWDVTTGGGGTGTDTMIQQSINANHGPWQSLLVLDLPVTTPIGTGHFEVSFGATVKYPLFVARVDNVEINMEILSDLNGNALIGEISDFSYRLTSFNAATRLGDLPALESLNQVVVKLVPNSGRAGAFAGAATYEVSVPVFDSSGADVSNQVANSQFAVVLDDRAIFIRNQVTLNWSRSGSNFSIIVMSPNGQQDYHAIRYSIFMIDEPSETANGWSLGAPLVTVAQYFDIDGNDITGSVIPPIAVLQ